MFELITDNLFSILLILIMLSVFIISHYTSQGTKNRHNTAWEKIATANRLSFSSNSASREGLHLTGEYRDHQLRLEPFETGQGKGSIAHTRISIFKKRPVSSLNNASAQQMVLQEAVSRFTTARPPHLLKGKVSAEQNGSRMVYEQVGIETDVEYLQYLFDLLVDLAEAYPHIVAIGGETVPFLQKSAKLALVRGNNGLRPITLQLLTTIAEETSQFEPQVASLLCAYCLAAYQAQEVQLGLGETITYYGCRICSQSRSFIKWGGPVTAVLDNDSEILTSQIEGILYVNWSVRRRLFDFQAVEIINATNEEVERFAVQIGNDSDELRRSRYQKMRCTISTICQLSENSTRILGQMIGQVEIGDLEKKFT